MISQLQRKMMSSFLAVLMVLSVLFTIIAPANQVFAAEDPVSVALRVEGPQGLIKEESAIGSTALDVLKTKFQGTNLDVTSSSYGSYVSGINGIQSGQYGGYDGWNFAVKRQGMWIIPDVSIDQYPLENNDQVLVYFGDLDTQLVKSISISSATLSANAPFSVTVTKTTYDWANTEFIDSAAEGVKVTIGPDNAVTNASGVAVFDHGVAAGNYTVEITDYRSDGAPGVVRGTQSLIVEVEPEPEPTPIGHVTASVEKFTIGQGFYQEPINVPLYEGDNGAAVIARVLGEGNYQAYGSIEDSFYVSKVKDNTAAIQVPSFIQDQINLNNDHIGLKQDEHWLSETDYTSMSGWMYVVNNTLPNVGASQYIPHDGDVFRIEFSLYGWGADLGANEWRYLPNPANKDALLTRIAGINSNPNKVTILADTAVRSAYEQAYTVLSNLESTQASVDNALTNLNKAFEKDTEKPSLTVSGISNNQEVSEANLSFGVVVTDNTPEGITSEVKLNGTAISKTDGLYALVLKLGANTVVVKATDSSGNTNEQTFVITYKIDIKKAAKDHLNKSLAYLLRTVDKPAFGTSGGEWTVLSLARANYTVPEGYYQSYYNNVVTEVTRLMTLNSGVLDKTKGTEHSRAILGLASIGKDPTKVGSYDLTSALSDYDYVIKQGINGPTFALLAFDARNYQIPTVEAGKKQATRANLVEYLLSKEIKKDTVNAGGWGFGSTVDYDLTSMALQALAPYYQTQPDVKSAGDRAVAWLSSKQDNEGGFGSSSESVAQVVTALTALGIDPSTDTRFIKNGKSAIDGLLSFAGPDGGFKHLRTGGVNALASDQGTYALVAYDRFINGNKRLYDMTDVIGDTPATGQTEIQLPSGNQPTINIPLDNLDYIIPITNADENKEITVVIPDDNNSKILVNLPSGTNLPKIEAKKGNISVVIPKGAQVTSGDTSALELITSNNPDDSGLKDKVNTLVQSGKKLDMVNQTITLGGSTRVEFNQFIKLTFAGMKGKEAAYIQNGSPSTIQRFSDDLAGIASGLNEYAYDSGNDLIVKTRHFTDFIAYTTSAVETPGGGTSPAKHVTLSVDKVTIDKGYVVPKLSVDLQTGDTVWSVLKRVLDLQGIVYKYESNREYGSVYVQSIAGDGEFDHGQGSGWMYNVNGTYPNYGAEMYTTLVDGDSIQWRYTTNYGEDLGQKIPSGALPMGSNISSTDKKPVIDVPADIKADYPVNITKELKDKELITINIPKVTSKIILNVDEVKDSIPMINAVKGDISLSIDKGTILKSGNSSIELLTGLDTNDATLQNLVKSSLSEEIAKQIKLINAFAMGNPNGSVLFDRPLTFVLKGAKGQQVGFIEGNVFTPIEIYATETEGIEATKGKEKITYAYVQDNDLIIKTNHFTSFVSYTNNEDTVFDLNKLYSDVKSISTWAVDAIGEATEKAFVEGSNGQFNPQATVTRAEFTKMLVGVLGLDVKAVNVINFKDVAQEDWFYPYVNAAHKAGLISGTSADQFSPNEKLTREQMAVIIVNALKLQAVEKTIAIDDLDQVSDWAKASVQAVIAHELMSGWDNRFQPTDQVTREMATVVAMRAYHDKVENK